MKQIKKLKQLNKNEKFILATLDKIKGFLRIHYYSVYKHYRGIIKINNRDCWNTIPAYDDRVIYQVYKTIYDKKKLRFLDVGSGFGNILLTASYIGFYAEGIEFQRTIFNHRVTRHVVHNMDAFDFKKYDDYDVIYTYMPIADPVEMGKLLQLITNQLSVGKIIIFKPAAIVEIPKELKRVDCDVYQKKLLKK